MAYSKYKIMSEGKVATTKDIIVRVGLDEMNLPVKMEWRSSDEPTGNTHEIKAMVLSMFDKETKDTMKLDLWTKDFQMNEMDRFIYHSLRSLADTYYKATKNKELASKMQQFANHFGEETEILEK